MRVIIPIVLCGFLLLSCFGIWKMGKPLAAALNVKRSVAGFLTYILIHFACIVLVVILFKYLMLWMVLRFPAP